MNVDLTIIRDMITAYGGEEKRLEALRRKTQAAFVNSLTKKYGSLRRAATAVGMNAPNLCAIRSGRRVVPTATMLEILQEVGYTDD